MTIQDSSRKTIIRKAHNKENPYAQISRRLLQDKSLSWKATGMLAYLLSLPDNWQINTTDLWRRKKDGRQSTRTILNELIKHGYVKKTIKRDDKGKFLRFEYIVHETKSYPLSSFRKMDTNKDTVPSFSHHDLQYEQAMKQDIEAAGLTYTQSQMASHPNKI